MTYCTIIKKLFMGVAQSNGPQENISCVEQAGKPVLKNISCVEQAGKPVLKNISLTADAGRLTLMNAD